MKRVIYLSQASSKTTPQLVEEIVAQAQIKNARLGITGILAFNGRNLLQCLEGPPASVDALMATIAHDPRHHSVTVVLEEEDMARAFEQWTMEYINLSTNVLTRRSHLVPMLPETLSPRARAIILSITTFG